MIAFEARQTFDTHEIRQMNNLSLANCVTHKKTVENYTKFNFQSLSNGVPWKTREPSTSSCRYLTHKIRAREKVWKVFREIKFCQTTREICKKIRVVETSRQGWQKYPLQTLAARVVVWHKMHATFYVQSRYLAQWLRLDSILILSIMKWDVLLWIFGGVRRHEECKSYLIFFPPSSFFFLFYMWRLFAVKFYLFSCNKVSSNHTAWQYNQVWKQNPI